MKRFLVLCSLFLFLPAASHAAAPIFIGEIAWAGSSASTADEWLELCGPPGTDLSGWSIDGAGSGDTSLALPDGSAVPPSGAFLIANYGSDDPKSTLAAAPDLVTTAVALSNSALFLMLRDAGGAAVDTAGRSGEAPLAGNSGAVKASMERLLPLADGGTDEAWATASSSLGFDAVATELGTPGTCPTEQTLAAPEETPSEPTASATETAPAPSKPSAPLPMSAVRISEAYPSPESGGQEWIELVNPSDLGEVLDGWTIEDGKGTSTPLSGTLLPWSRSVIVSPKGQLNNDGDLIVLKDASGRVLDGVAYGTWDSTYPNVGEVRKGESLIRIELQDAFAVTTTPTPGSANVLVARAADATEEKAVTEVPPPAPAAVSFRPEAQPERSPPAGRAGNPSETGEIPRLQPAAPASARDDDRETTMPSLTKKKVLVAKKPKPSRYKGSPYVGIVASPPGVYSKTRMFALIGGDVREVRLSKAAGASYLAGSRIAFVAQEKTEGADPYLLANPNSFRRLDASASATFATAEAWPERAGAYRFDAQVVSSQAGVLEAKLAGVEGDILAPSTLTASLKSGDIVSVEGYVSPGPRPRTVLARPEALRLFKAYQAEAPSKAPPAKLPWPAAAGLTLAAALVGLYAYLRHQRLQRLALVLTPVDGDEDP